MKKTALVCTLVAFSLLSLLLSYPGAIFAFAQGSSYTIESIDHQIEVMYCGNVVIRDTVTISGQTSDGFLIGFPYKYSSYVLKGVAFSSGGILPLSLGVQLGERSGFYGAEVSFPSGSPGTFTVIFVLSNELLASYSGGFYLDFPAYPSLVQEASRCNVNIVLPSQASVETIEKDDGIVNSGKFEKSNLPAFSYSPANATIVASEGLIQQVTFTSLDRVITLGIAGEIVVADMYRIINNSTSQIASLKLDVPINASNVVAKDELGTRFSSATTPSGTSPTIASLDITLTAPLRSGQSVITKVEYNLLSIPAEQTRFALNLEIYPYFNYYIPTASITVTFPEGARIVESPPPSQVPLLTIDREIYQETLRVNLNKLSYVDHEVNPTRNAQIVYEYNSLWVSLRPTFWVWGLAAVGSVVIVIMRRPKSKALKSPKVAMPKLSGGKIGSEQVKSFVDAYEERARLSSEVKTVTERVQKGKMPRRQYKVQRRALELRINTLTKIIADLKPTFNAAGGNYADLARQLDTAEAEINSVEANLRIVEASHKTGEIPLGDYKKSILDLKRRREKAESKIHGILLRLHEEIR